MNDKAGKIKLLVMDVDGTLTDGTVFYSAEGEAMKRFSLRDGMGVELLRKAGIDAAIITSENSKIVMKRAEKLKIEHVMLGSRNKKQSLLELAGNLRLSTEQIAYIGDDVNDIQPMQTAGYSACPADSADEVKKAADYICRANGGNGAAREFCELILKTQDKPVVLPESW